MALLVLDAKRLSQSRLDCLPCLRVPYRDATGAWVYEDVNSDDYDTDMAGGYTPAPPGPLNPASGLLSGLNRALGRGGSGGGGAGQGSAGQDPGEVYFPPQQELPPVAGGQQQQQQQRGGRAAAVQGGSSAAAAANRLGVLPGVTKSGPGLLHGDMISLQSVLQVSEGRGEGGRDGGSKVVEWGQGGCMCGGGGDNGCGGCGGRGGGGEGGQG